MIGSKKQLEKEKSKSMDLKDKLPEIDESLGELLCDECGGRGCLPPEINDISTLQSVCWKCQGDGKVDWVSHITGKPPRRMFGFSSSSFSTYAAGTSGSHSHVHDDIVDALAQNLAKKIDEEIMDNLLNPHNKHMKFYNQEVKQGDNGIVSKFMLHSDIK